MDYAENDAAIRYYKESIRGVARSWFSTGQDRETVIQMLSSRISHYTSLLRTYVGIDEYSITLSQNKEPIQVFLPKEFTEEGTPVDLYIKCDISGQYFSVDSVVRFFDSPTSICKLVGRSYVRPEWWWYKKKSCYTSYKFEYLPFDGYKKSPRFWKNPDSDLNVLGFEFEWRFNSLSDKLAFANAVYNKHRPCICEKDGSLDNGSMNGPSLEVITPPWTFDEARKNVAKLLHTARLNNITEPGDGYGLHITVNCCSKIMIDRIIFLVNNQVLRDFWISLAGRDTSLVEKDYAKFIHYDNLRRAGGIDHLSRWNSSPVDHFYATFLRKNSSIELRFFKSSIDISRIESILKIVKRLVFFCKYSSNTYFSENWTHFPNIYVRNRI